MSKVVSVTTVCRCWNSIGNSKNYMVNMQLNHDAKSQRIPEPSLRINLGSKLKLRNSDPQGLG